MKHPENDSSNRSKLLLDFGKLISNVIESCYFILFIYLPIHCLESLTLANVDRPTHHDCS